MHKCRRKNATAILVTACVASTLAMAVPCPAADVRIKDITNVEGVRTYKLTGMGLVAGLNGTGGTNPETRQFAQNMLERFGLRNSPELRRLVRNDAKLKTNNLSVVTVTLEVPVYAKPGAEFDVIVSAFDDASSLQGGVLIDTPLVGWDKKVYAVASGAVSIGGFSFSGEAANVQKNHPTTGRIPDGAKIEEELPSSHRFDDYLRLLLQSGDFETGRRIADVINKAFPQAAGVEDQGTIGVHIPKEFRHDQPTFIAMINALRVPPDIEARVVINERTGTIIVGENVRLSKVAIMHANLSVITGETPEVSQPAPFARRGRTEVVPRTDIDVVEERRPVHVFDEPVTVGDLAQALNGLGVSPQDLSSIFQQLKASGALHAELHFQ